MTLSRSFPLPAWLLLLALILLGIGAAVRAQLEGGDRGVAPIDSSGSFEVGGVDVDVAAKTADAARYAGWREAQRKGWRLLWARVNGQPVNAAPRLPDSTLDSIVSGIVVENEQIGPNRYIAQLGVLFDRARTGQLLGVKGQIMRSPPMLVIPIMYAGGAATSFETRNEWQKAWARFRSGGSPIDYVRPSGTGSDPLLLNMGQTRRPARSWWRMLLDQFGAADVVVPEVSITRLWPGGPVIGRFAARHGPDNRVIERFALRVENGDALPQLLDEGVKRIDAAYGRALRDGRMQPDPSLVIEEPAELEEELPVDDAALPDSAIPVGATVTVQAETPDPGALFAAESTLRAIPNVKSVSTTSLALGGISVIRVIYAGDLASLRTALAARGWAAVEGDGAIRMRRQAGGASAPPPGGEASGAQPAR